MEPSLDAWIEAFIAVALEPTRREPIDRALVEQMGPLPEAVARSLLALMYYGRGDGDLGLCLTLVEINTRTRGAAQAILSDKGQVAAKYLRKGMTKLAPPERDRLEEWRAATPEAGPA
jgi:hypothetical protein